MKKLITICLIAFAFVLGTQSVEAQEKDKIIQETVKNEVVDLKKVLGLDQNQTALVERILYSKAKRQMELSAQASDLTGDKAAKIQTKIDTDFKAKMMDVLTEEQFQNYSNYMGKKEKKKIQIKE